MFAQAIAMEKNMKQRSCPSQHFVLGAARETLLAGIILIRERIRLHGRNVSCVTSSCNVEGFLLSSILIVLGPKHVFDSSLVKENNTMSVRHTPAVI